ncbi:MAG: hypothetical protein IJ246_02550 [Clostridia bacterium]|nr:hypothetical protein [Clostridia bacterium]
MYSENDLVSARKQLRRRWLCLLLPSILLFALQVFYITQRNEPMTTALGIILVVLFIFAFELFVLPVQKYTRFVREVVTGPHHDVDGVFEQFDAETSLIDGVVFRGMHVTCLDDLGDPYDRLFYLDAQKPAPSLSKGQKVSITYHDRQIIALS